MKKQFKINELVRKRYSVQFGQVRGMFTDSEYFCEFDGVIKRYTVDELSYHPLKTLKTWFKMCFEWIKEQDNKTPEEISNDITYYFQSMSLKAHLQRFFFGLGLLSFFWICVMFFSIFF